MLYTIPDPIHNGSAHRNQYKGRSFCYQSPPPARRGGPSETTQPGHFPHTRPSEVGPSDPQDIYRDSHDASTNWMVSRSHFRSSGRTSPRR
jgi:hypothetical protein